MRIEELSELEDRLRRQPSWEPPPGFVRRVALLASAASEQWPPVHEERRSRIVRAAAIGLRAAAAVYVIGSLISLMMPLVLRDASSAIDAYARLVELPTQLMASRAVQVAWLSAAASLSFSASLVLRARA
jgi:hypothetical protein